MERSFSFESRLAELGSALDRIERLLADHVVESDLVADVRLVAEEGMVNIVRNAYPEEKGDIEITLSVNVTEVRLVLRDRGRPFNPLEHPAPDLGVAIGERPEGGLGIHLIRSLTDDRSYSREGDENVLVLIKRHPAR
jgi:anti-sigma regulatory factor (Ser/Thr protein kinase)